MTALIRNIIGIVGMVALGAPLVFAIGFAVAMPVAGFWYLAATTVQQWLSL